MSATVVDLGPSECVSVPQHLCITGMSLQAGNPACAGGDQRVVNVWVEYRHDAYLIGTLSSTSEPIVPVHPQVVGDDEVVLWHDGVAATVRFYASVACQPPPPSVAGAEEEASTVLEEDGSWEGDASFVEFCPHLEVVDADRYNDSEDCEEDEVPSEEYDPLSEEEEAERFDSDDGEEDEVPSEEFDLLSEEEEAERFHSDDGEEVEDDVPPRKVTDEEATRESSRKSSNILPLVAAPPGTVVPDGEFVGPARFAAVENTAGFMRLAAAAEDAAATDQDRKEITVFYRYTRFSRTWSGRRGVEPCRRTKLHRLRFAVPPGGDTASSLAWAGASLGPLVYPALFRRKLRELWTSLATAAPAIASTVPPRAARVQVIVDVAILRREDCTPERMAYMRAALEDGMREAWPDLYHVGMDLHLPQPVRREDEQGGGEDARPAKRRKMVEDDDEECSVCFDPLESDLAAWPGCRHVFHGACLENTLAGSEMCPLCRTKLSG